MSNKYFDWPASLKRMVRFDSARAEDINGALDELSAGMDEVDADIGRAIKLPEGAGDQVITAEAGQRAGKILAFDALGNVTVSNNDVDSAADSAAAAAERALAADSSADASATSASQSEASRIEASKLNLGAKAADPATDNQGEPLRAGATYLNTALTPPRWRVWTGAAWAAGVTEGVTSVNGDVGDVVIPPTPEVPQPANASPAAGATGVLEQPTLTGSTYYSLYGAAQSALQVQVSTSPTFAATVYDSGSLPAATSHTLPSGVLVVSTAYHWRLRYQNTRGAWSEWSAGSSFATAATFPDYIDTPAATPANFGDPLEGGFYAGMIWGELVQSATSTTIGTGSKTFTVPNMAGAPIVYEGQQLEVRSRANPANKMMGTVTGAFGTQLTINVTSVGGSGTFTDWSVMSRYRLIVAPKASGENAGVQIKNANTDLPVACRTLNEGMRATQAMRDADTNTVYPAAHWARGLNIGGRTDWYIPARDELELCWRNLKPTTTASYVTADRPTSASYDYKVNGAYGDTANTHGLNNNSAPPGAAYTSGSPAQTTAAAFKTGGTEAFEFGSAYYWSSSEYSASSAWSQYWNSSYPGYQNSSGKANALRARAARRSII